MSSRRQGALPYLAFVGLGLIWGASFLFFKLGVQDMSPPVLVFVRSASGALTLAAIMWLSGRSLTGGKVRERIVHFVIMGTTNAVIPWIAIAWGEQTISSGLASILNATTPFWTALFIYWVIPLERPSVMNYAGVLLGIAGVVILVIPDISTHGLSGNVLGALAVVVASMSYAVSALYQRARMRGMDIFQQSLGQLVASSLIALPLAAPSLPRVHLALLSMGAVLALGAAGSGVAYLLYYYTLNTLGPVRATGVTFIVPITAVFWGVVLLHESLSLAIIAGMIVILVGIVLTNTRRRAAARHVVSEKEKAAV
ncbi:MAG TPA: DMT family transporter [Candidatus Dormibacteraeota bacterium]|nr:DMT family transporter [Candidatus Dormibacteraeota bacterium]